MRILVIVHQFPPKESAGTEVYAYKLAKGLQERGHDLTVYTTQSYPDREQYGVGRHDYDGLPVIEVVNNHEFGHFRGTYKDERMEAHLRDVLDEVKPDVVHIQHLHLHSIDYVSIIKDRGIPILYTLAEYLNICPRNGWLAKLDFTLCEGPQPDACAVCASGVWPPPQGIEHAPPPQPAPVMAAKPEAPASNVYVPPYKPFSLTRFAGKVRRKITGGAPPANPYEALASSAEPAAPAPAPFVQQSGRHPWVPAIERRWEEVSAQLAKVDLFVAPSNFLRDQYIKAGMIEPERIVYSDYGFDHTPFENMEPHVDRGDDTLRVGFIGSIAEQKGIHLIVEAFNELPEQGVECHIYGGLTGWPDYVQLVRERRAHLGVRLMGPYVNNQIAKVLRSMDVLIVPSRWYENSPLTIHEAFMAGLPVITGDRGGMAELVQHEVNGLHFKMDDARDLRRQIQRLAKDPELLATITRSTPVKTVAEDAAETEERLENLLRQAVPAG